MIQQREKKFQRGETTRKRYKLILFAVSVIGIIIFFVSESWLFGDSTEKETFAETCKRGECENHPKSWAMERKTHTQSNKQQMFEFESQKKEKQEEKHTDDTLIPLEADTLYKSVCASVIRGEEDAVFDRAQEQFTVLLNSLTKHDVLKHAPALRSLYEQCILESGVWPPISRTYTSLLQTVMSFNEGDSLEDLLGLFAKFDIANPLSLSFELHPKHGLRLGKLVLLISQHEIRFSHNNEGLDTEFTRVYNQTFGIPRSSTEKTRFDEFAWLYQELHILRPTHNSGTKMVDYALRSPAFQEEMLKGRESINEFMQSMKDVGFDMRRYFKASGITVPEDLLWVHSPHTMLDFARLAHVIPHTAWRDYLFVILRSLVDPELMKKATEDQHYVYHTHYSGRWALPWDVPSQYEFVTSQTHCMGLVEAYLPHATNEAIERAIPDFKKTANRVRQLFGEAKAIVLKFVKEDKYELFGKTPVQLLRKLENTQIILFDEAYSVREMVDTSQPSPRHTQHYLDTILEIRQSALHRASTMRWNPELPDARMLYDQLATPENAFFVHQLNAIVFNLGLLHAFATGLINEIQIQFLLAHELAHGLDATGLFYDDRGGLTLEVVFDPIATTSHEKWYLELEKHYKRASVIYRVDNDLLRTEHENFADAVATLSMVQANSGDAKKVSEMMRSVAKLFCIPLPENRHDDVRYSYSSTHSFPSVRADAIWSLASKSFEKTPVQPRYS